MYNQSEEIKINNVNKQKITKIWDEYVRDAEKVIDLKGNKSLANEFDKKRIIGIEKVEGLIEKYMKQKIDLQSFKSSLDSENKINNYWGFSAIKGQMFFNQLVNSQNGNLDVLHELLIKIIKEPKDIEAAKNKIKILEDFVNIIYKKADDKRKSPKPSSIPYFLSYFWQIHNYKKWPIYYTSLINSLTNLELWENFSNQYDSYEYFYNLMYTVKKLLEDHYKNGLTHWDVEHCFWWNQLKNQRGKPKKGATAQKQDKIVLEAITTFKLYDYIPPIISDLIEIGKQKGENCTKKGVKYENKVALAFKILDFLVEELGQGKGREPDSIAKYRPENIAFIIDAKAYSQDYSIGVGDRAIKEYINKHLPRLKKEGYQKNGFIIVSSSFKGDPKKFIDEITLETDIKRLTLLTSEALLYLVAYKLKGNISITDIANALLKNGIIEAKDIVEAFEDV